MLTHQNDAQPDAGPPEAFNKAALAGIVAICFILALIDGYSALSLSFVAPLVSKALLIDHETMGRIFGINYVGMVIGSIIMGPASDRLGYRSMIIVGMVVLGAFTLACATVNSAMTLGIYRLIGGIGMGGLLPPLFAAAAEAAPARYRSSLAYLIYIGVPVGAVVGGATSAVLMADYGWRIIFIIGGVAALVAILPVPFVIPAGRSPHNAATPRQNIIRFLPTLLSEGRGPAAVTMWLGVFLTYVLSAFVGTLMSTILNLNGYSPSIAATAAMLVQVGAIAGALFLSAIVRKTPPFLPVGCALVSGSVLVFLLGHTLTSQLAVYVMLFLVGAALIGSHLGTPAMTIELFPQKVRAAGLGWSLGIGRAGSIVGPVVGGSLLSLDLPITQVLAVGSAVGLGGSICIFYSYAVRPRPEAQHVEPSPPTQALEPNRTLPYST
jgi:AAHS family 4-hydroxybenzoate transporter-like MFS transporter